MTVFYNAKTKQWEIIGDFGEVIDHYDSEAVANAVADSLCHATENL